MQVQPAEEQIIAELKEKEKEIEEELEMSKELTSKKDKEAIERSNKKRAKQYRDSVRQSGKNTDVAAKESKRDLRRKADSINRANQALAYREMVAQKRQKRQDSINVINKAREEAIALNVQRQQDSLNQIANTKTEAERLALKNEVVIPKAGERYEEVTKQGNLEPGYYLIANVFGTKRYFDAFMGDMKKRGISAGSFYRETNKYNYIYLGRYTSIDEARKARESKLDGKYQEKTWIFRVTGE